MEDITGLADRVIRGDGLAAARLITAIEDEAPAAAGELERLGPYCGGAFVVGVTGAPGAGKSTLINGLAECFGGRDMKLGVLAVDPSSPYSGGAILGDRIRMRHSDGVFYRSLASRGQPGGLSAATLSAILVLDALGKDIILVETVGSGQAEVAVADVCHTSVLVLVPGMGDDIQLMKAGILEVADILVVNKADREGTESLLQGINAMLGARQRDGDVVSTEATCGRGLPRLAEAILARRQIFISGGRLKKRRQPVA
jgi:LAO/AO transport system kinase